MRARSVLLRIAVATSTIVAVTLGSGVTAHAAPPELKITDVTVTEGDAGTSSATFTINYGGPGGGREAGGFAPPCSSAPARRDYTPNGGTGPSPAGGRVRARVP